MKKIRNLLWDLLQKIPKTANLYVVGGAVRDLVLKKDPNDIDVCVEGVGVDYLSGKLGLPMVNPSSGIPVFVYHTNGMKIEVTVPRRERKVPCEDGNSHKSFVFDYGTGITIEEDLIRRDVTINAMALKLGVDGEEIIDPFGGQKDIQNKVIRHVSDHFIEDPLRVFRLYRFTAKGFSVAEETKRFLMQHKDYLEQEISQMPVERISEEIKKAMCEEHPHRFFEAMVELGIGQNILPEIFSMAEIPAGPEYDRTGRKTCHEKDETVFQHSINVLKTVSSTCKKPQVRFAAFLHDFGKIYSSKESLPHHYKHETTGETRVMEFLQKFKFDNSYVNLCASANRWHTNFSNLASMRPAKVFSMLEKIRNFADNLQIIANADTGVSDDLLQKYLQVVSLPTNNFISSDRLMKVNCQQRKSEILHRKVEYFTKEVM